MTILSEGREITIIDADARIEESKEMWERFEVGLAGGDDGENRGE